MSAPGATTALVERAPGATRALVLAGDRVIAARNSFVMIHDAMTGVFGNRQAFARALELLDKVSDNIADMYAEKAGEDVEFWRGQMLENGEDGVWYTGADALDAGLVDEITGGEDDDEDVDNLLRGWVNLLPREVAARVENSAPRASEEIEEYEETSAVTIDVTALNNIMKGVFE